MTIYYDGADLHPGSGEDRYCAPFEQPAVRRASAASRLSFRVIVSAAANPDAQTAGDSYGHGTHIAGNGANRPDGDPLDSAYVGSRRKQTSSP